MRLRMSLLNRLIDDDPGRARDPILNRTEEMRAVRNGFRRDLEGLLNTRRLCRSPPAAYKELSNSILSYGIEDFIGAPLATYEQRQELVTAVEQTIADFEPRFTTVSVTLIKARDPAERQQTIRIEAIVQLEQGPEPLIFQTVLDPTTQTFRVE